MLPALLLSPFGRWDRFRTMKIVAGVDHRQTPEIAGYLGLIFTHFLSRKEKLPVFTDGDLARLT
ncbi:hypothetical protein [Amycolatopsis sp.]|uniref:hypothetical protein n=1 Tax=Amycolatopsis sp. TaxID=37632 RepID=UPI002C6B363E|nr:hypothetical protein [Amycolatopsis sp.]HVV10440.1 hypothetical protein [Amycolatopsis sp.]